MDWKPTHIIVFYDEQEQEVTARPVMQFETPSNPPYMGFYQKEEWERQVPSAWFIDEGKLTCNGNPTPLMIPGEVHCIELGKAKL